MCLKYIHTIEKISYYTSSMYQLHDQHGIVGKRNIWHFIDFGIIWGFEYSLFYFYYCVASTLTHVITFSDKLKFSDLF